MPVIHSLSVLFDPGRSECIEDDRKSGPPPVRRVVCLGEQKCQDTAGPHQIPQTGFRSGLAPDRSSVRAAALQITSCSHR